MQQPDPGPIEQDELARPVRQATYSITDDPIFYGAVIVFAVLTTAIPAVMGQPRFLPLVQTLALTTFLAMVVRHRNMKQVAAVLVGWLIIQFIIITLLAWAAPGSMDRAIAGGFERRTAFVAWLFAEGALPDSLLVRPIGRVGELFILLLGGAATGGLLAVWILVRSVNLAGFYTGSLLIDTSLPAALALGLPPWTLLRLTGYAGFSAIVAEPLLIKNWSPGHLLQNRRQLLLVSTGCLLLGLILELVLPGIWKSLAGRLVQP